MVFGDPSARASKAATMYRVDDDPARLFLDMYWCYFRMMGLVTIVALSEDP
jgi:hypothetical protein